MRGLAKSSGLLGELVKFLSRSAGVHLLKFLIERFDLLGCHARKLADIGHLLFHLGVGVDSLTPSEDKTRNGGSDSKESHLPLVDPVHYAVGKGLLFAHSLVDSVNLRFNRLDFSDMSIPSGSAALDAVQLVFELPEGFVKLLRCRFVKAAENIIDGGRRTS